MTDTSIFPDRETANARKREHMEHAPENSETARERSASALFDVCICSLSLYAPFLVSAPLPYMSKSWYCVPSYSDLLLPYPEYTKKKKKVHCLKFECSDFEDRQEKDPDRY